MTERVGVLMVGANGSIATTLVAGVFAALEGLSELRAVLTSRPEFDSHRFIDLAALVFGGWDLRRDLPFSEMAQQNAEAPPGLIRELRAQLDGVAVMPGVAIGLSEAVRTQIGGVSADASRADAAKRIQADIERFIDRHQLTGAVVVNLALTEPPATFGAWRESISSFEAALAADDPAISAGMIYAYAALMAGCPVINYTPSDIVEFPALTDLAVRNGIPLAGRDGKTGQTFYKTVLAPAFLERGLEVVGWYSTNILGNGDGMILNSADNAQSKRRSKGGVLDKILGYEPEHQVHIHYFRALRQRKEAWDAIEMLGWLGMPVQMRINWSAPDSVLAAPMVLDLVRLIWWAKQQGRRGPQGYLGAFFKEGIGCPTPSFPDQMRLLREVLLGGAAQG